MSEEKTLFERGTEVRSQVLGAEYVTKSLESADDFTRPFLELATQFCWGSIWTREGLSHKTRSLLNLAMMTVLNRQHELRVHLRGAVRNGCTELEIREVLLQTVAYAGIPAGVDAFKTAREVFAELAAASNAL